MYWNHVATSYLVGCIDKSRNIPGLKPGSIHEQGNPSVKSHMLQSWYLTKGLSIPSALVRYRLKFSQAHWCCNDKTTESISFMVRKTVFITLKKKTSYPPSHTIIEDTIRHNIAQITSTSKAYIPCFLAIIIKWCHIIAWDRRQHHDGGR